MPTLEEIKVQINSLDGVQKFLGRKEIKELPNILWEDEKVEKLASGFYNGGNGVIVATNKRLLFVDKGLIYGLRVEDFPYDKINSLQHKTGMLLGELDVFASGNRAQIKNVEKNLVRGIAEYIRARITPVKESVVAPKDNNSTITQLKELAELREKGILTEEEFQGQKQKILAK